MQDNCLETKLLAPRKNGMVGIVVGIVDNNPADRDPLSIFKGILDLDLTFAC